MQKFFLILLLLFSSCGVCATKHFSDYKEITLTKKSDPSICRVHLNAKQKIIDRVEDPFFKNNQWKLVMRRGLFKAEVEMAMSQLFYYFIGFSTDLDYVEENGDHYIARREFKSFEKWDDVVTHANDSVHIKEYELLDDGILIKDGSRKRFTGLGYIVALAEFFGDNDAKHYNYGIQENENEIRVIDYDLEDAFNFGDSVDIEEALANEFGENFIHSTWYKNEKRAMQKKIAKTNFSVIENIIRKNLTVTRLNATAWLFEKILRDSSAYPDWDRQKVKQALEKIRSEPDTSQTVDQIIDELRARHFKLKSKAL